ncbi:TetR/AcrR family transcriptional regulator [Marinoscillum pacificum]|uniref:TetR/AcrR family transcriptional regulator n=1 Tax=Marinoscillum pacificum TaxID=392723 RepID=UPI0021571058|nr:TetR/AcrR family transcriptional regulator [Marinoscillum pacificum]
MLKVSKVFLRRNRQPEFRNLEELREKIIEGAQALFIQYGIRSVSMDDVARTLSMSKKTLYQHFSNKNELVTDAVENYMKGEMAEFADIHDHASNAIEELYNLSKCMREHVFKINPSMLYDLQKYHADAWEIFNRFKNRFLRGQIVDNINKGIEEGNYRPDIDPRVIAVLRLETVQLAFNDQIFPRSEFNFLEVQMQLFDHFVHGVLSDKGKQLYNDYQMKEVNS